MTLNDLVDLVREKPNRSISIGSWIDWDGNDKHPLPECAHEFYVRFRNGAESGPYSDGNYLHWKHDLGHADIVAYKISSIKLNIDPNFKA